MLALIDRDQAVGLRQRTDAAHERLLEFIDGFAVTGGGARERLDGRKVVLDAVVEFTQQERLTVVAGLLPRDVDQHVDGAGDVAVLAGDRRRIKRARRAYAVGR